MPGQERNDEVCNDKEVANENVEVEKHSEQSGEITTPSTSKTSTSNAHTSLSNFINVPDIKRDTEFLDKLQQIVIDRNISKLFIPHRQRRQQILKNLVSKITSRYQ